MNLILSNSGTPLSLVHENEFEQWRASQPTTTQQWLTQTQFEGSGSCVVPSPTGEIEQALVVHNSSDLHWVLAEAATTLPATTFTLNATLNDEQTYQAALGWLLAQYSFDRYKANTKTYPTLAINSESAFHRAQTDAKAVCLTRDLVNTPAGDMMPEHLSDALKQLASEHSAQFNEVVGDDLLTENYPTIHMVGRASIHAPRLLELNWGEPSHPKVTVIGKGVCFDSGGLDLKPANAMRLMKKDMGGAAHALGLASLIMSHQLPIQLRVLIPAVENAVSSNAFRPGDVVKTRKGLTVEIDNTDAEGRLVLCDALADADEQGSDLIIDFATLTGAARVALGLEVPAFYATEDAFANSLMQEGSATDDAIWRLPLHQPYASFMNGSISDLVNASATPFGGSITAALYLKRFVENAEWVHFDVGAWNDRPRPGRPKGGEAMGLRAVFSALTARYAQSGE